MRTNLQSREKGFIVLKLAVVISVIAILAAILIPTFCSIIKQANQSAHSQSLSIMKEYNSDSVAKNGVALLPDGYVFLSRDCAFTNINNELFELESVREEDYRDRNTGSYTITFQPDVEPLLSAGGKAAFSLVKAHTHTPGEAVQENLLAPTFDAVGSYDSVVYCSTCGEELSRESITVDRLEEKIHFTYEIAGEGGSNTAYNNGTVTVLVYMNVESEIARLYGIDFSLAFDECLTLESAFGKIFSMVEYTNLTKANEDHALKLSQNMGFGYPLPQKTFAQGSYLFATLTFRVDPYFYYDTASIRFVEGSATIARMYQNQLSAEFDEGASIDVLLVGEPKPGDVDGNGVINMVDVLTLCRYYVDGCKYDPDGYAVTIYENAGDVDGNGVINMVDVLTLCRYYVDGCKYDPDGYGVELVPGKMNQN